MKMLNIYVLIGLIGLIGFQPCFAKITSNQIEMLTQLTKDMPIGEQELQDFITHFDDIRAWIENDVISSTSIGRASGTCKVCTSLIGLIVGSMRAEIPPIIIKSLIKSVCQILLVPKVLSAEVCNGAVDNYAGPLEFILKEKRDMKAADICGMYTGTEGGCDPINEAFTNWTISINGDKPKINELPLLPESTEGVKFLHLTDIHPDLHYIVGSNKECNEPMCCRGSIEANESLQAGFFGDYRCDMPEHSMLDLFRNAAKRYDDYAFVLMTGDLVHHTIWKTTKEDNLNHYKAVNAPLVEEIFTQTPIYPVIGNHEPHPCNMFPPQSVWGKGDAYNLSWVYNTIADSYSRWLPQDAQATFRKAGYYTLKIPNGPRLVTLNTNFCYVNNFWLFYESRDPEGQLQWLADTLDEAEKNGDIVYIAGHVPPGQVDCWNVWNTKFHEIIIRYEAIIKAQFYGHTHNDDTTIFFDNSISPPRPANVLNIGVSVTPYKHLNPGYKVFYADGTGTAPTWEMMNHETWVYNLSDANKAGSNIAPEWYKLYSMKEAFGLSSLRPTELYDLVLKMVTNEELFQKYYSFYNKGSHDVEPCVTNECKMEYLCEMVRADSSDYSHCERLAEYAESKRVQ